ncbi:hypothetical protein JCM8208_004303 [Rhodotorula glutinis]
MAQLADQHGLLSVEETQNVYALGQLPGVRDQLVALRDQLRANPHHAGAIDQLHRFIIRAVQEFQHLDNADYDALGPTRVPPLHDLVAFDEILQAVLARDDDTPLRIVVEILECLPYDHPKNFHPLRRDVPGDPEPKGTRLVVLAVEAVLGAIAPDLKYWVHDPFAQCRAPPLQAAVQRGALGSTRVPAAWIETAQLLSEIFFDLVQHLNIEVVQVMANGDVARRFAGMPNLNGALDLFSETLPSAFFDLDAYQLYHPSILANSAYVELRTALLYRRCIILAWIADKPDHLRDIYDALAGLLQLEVDAFDVIAGVARYDATTDPDLHDTFFAVSCFVKGFVRLYGTGKFGGRPQFDGTSSGTIACSGYVARRRAWAKKHDRKDEPELSVEAWLTLFGQEDPSTLRALLVDSGFGEAELLSPEQILPFYLECKAELVVVVGKLDAPSAETPAETPAATRREGGAVARPGGNREAGLEKEIVDLSAAHQKLVKPFAQDPHFKLLCGIFYARQPAFKPTIITPESIRKGVDVVCSNTVIRRSQVDDSYKCRYSLVFLGGHDVADLTLQCTVIERHDVISIRWDERLKLFIFRDDQGEPVLRRPVRSHIAKASDEMTWTIDDFLRSAVNLKVAPRAGESQAAATRRVGEREAERNRVARAFFA